MKYHSLITLLVLLVFCSCGTQRKSISRDQPGIAPDSAKSVQLKPTMAPEYYTTQGVKYFRSMESSVSNKVRPYYSDLVIRWEWHPWLLLTGYKRTNLINTDILLKLYPTRYDTMDCRYFEKEPFCRCHVIFNYSGKRFPIYEEFTFNNKGEITFIEAWSDYPGLLPMDKKDYWAQGDVIKRLSTRVPGLGNATGRINLRSRQTKEAAGKDAELADLIHRTKHPFATYIREFLKQRKEMARAVNPPAGDQFPYYP